MPSTSTSFGHFTRASRPAAALDRLGDRRARRRATAARQRRAGRRTEHERDEQRRRRARPPSAARAGRAPRAGGRWSRRPPPARRPAGGAASSRTRPRGRTACRAGRAAAARPARARGRVTRRAGVARFRFTVGAPALRREAALPRRRRRPRRAPLSLDVQGVGELRDEPLDGELAVPRLAPLVLGDGPEHRAGLREDARLLPVRQRRSTPRRRRRASTRVSDVFACWPPGPRGAGDAELDLVRADRDGARDADSLPPVGHPRECMAPPGRRGSSAPVDAAQRVRPAVQAPTLGNCRPWRASSSTSTGSCTSPARRSRARRTPSRGFGPPGTRCGS